MVYRPGHFNPKADISSRYWGHVLDEGGKETLQEETRFLKPDQLVMSSAQTGINTFWVRSIRAFRLLFPLLEELKQAALKVDFWLSIKQILPDEPKIINPNFLLKNWLVFYKSCWCIPSEPSLNQKLFSSFNDSKVAGHFGQYETVKHIRALFKWPKMDEVSEEYIRSSYIC